MSLFSTRSFAVILGMALSIAGIEGHGQAKRWTYAGATGPAKWGTLNKDFAQCAQGQSQSPVDILDEGTWKGDFGSLLFNYKPSPLKIVDTGYTIQVNYAPGSFVAADGDRYELVAVQFHRPGEQKIDGKAYNMEAHLVHRGLDGSLAIIAVLLDAGRENQLIKTLWENIPKAKGTESAVEGVTINALDLLPEDKGYYSFPGSLTAPPCTENVTWFVLKTPVEVSAGAVARFAKIYPMNARPVQPLNGRQIRATR